MLVWTCQHGNVAFPAARLLFSSVSQRTIVFGGIGRPTTDDAVTRYGDMWSFDGTKWTELKPATLPSIRYGSATGFNPETNTVVMFGGKSATEVYLNEHWEWDGQNWKQLQLFEREAATLKSLSHPNIPAYVDYFEEDTSRDKGFFLVQVLNPGSGAQFEIGLGY